MQDAADSSFGVYSVAMADNVNNDELPNGSGVDVNQEIKKFLDHCAASEENDQKMMAGGQPSMKGNFNANPETASTAVISDTDDSSESQMVNDKPVPDDAILPPLRRVRRCVNKESFGNNNPKQISTTTINGTDGGSGSQAIEADPPIGDDDPVPPPSYKLRRNPIKNRRYIDNNYDGYPNYGQKSVGDKPSSGVQKRGKKQSTADRDMETGESSSTTALSVTRQRVETKAEVKEKEKEESMNGDVLDQGSLENGTNGGVPIAQEESAHFESSAADKIDQSASAVNGTEEAIPMDDDQTPVNGSIDIMRNGREEETGEIQVPASFGPSENPLPSIIKRGRGRKKLENIPKQEVVPAANSFNEIPKKSSVRKRRAASNLYESTGMESFERPPKRGRGRPITAEKKDVVAVVAEEPVPPSIGNDQITQNELSSVKESTPERAIESSAASSAVENGPIQTSVASSMSLRPSEDPDLEKQEMPIVKRGRGRRKKSENVPKERIVPVADPSNGMPAEAAKMVEKIEEPKIATSSIVSPDPSAGRSNRRKNKPRKHVSMDESDQDNNGSIVEAPAKNTESETVSSTISKPAPNSIFNPAPVSEKIDLENSTPVKITQGSEIAHQIASAVSSLLTGQVTGTTTTSACRIPSQENLKKYICCMCDRRVNSANLSYIVIRLPACYDCADNGFDIIVTDVKEKPKENGGEPAKKI